MRLPHRLLPAVLAAGLPAAAADVTPPSGPARAPRLVPTAATPPPSTFFATTSIGSRATTQANGDGDLWANCWSDDDHVYTAHGDGKGFGGTFSDIGVNRVTGMPGSLAGTTLALGDQVGQVWTANHTRKPTGMACVDGALYLAVQDLALDFDDAPSATIARSNDKGSTWTWNRSAPMFGGGAFTTIMFLDYGKDYANAIDGYVYAYGLDHNQRDSFANRVPDPVDVYLGRVPRAQIQNRSAWQFVSGFDGSGNPLWSSNIAGRYPVLHDDRRIYPDVYTAGRRTCSWRCRADPRSAHRSSGTTSSACRGRPRSDVDRTPSRVGPGVSALLGVLTFAQVTVGYRLPKCLIWLVDRLRFRGLGSRKSISQHGPRVEVGTTRRRDHGDDAIGR